MNILDLSYNSDISLITCSTTDGFCIYRLNPLKKIIHINIPNGTSIAKILDRTNISFVIGRNDEGCGTFPQLWDIQKKSVDLEFSLKENAVNAHVLRNNKGLLNLIVVLKNKIHRINHLGMKIDYKDTYINKYGICIVNNDLIATLGVKHGDVALWDLKTNKYTVIHAHQNKIKAITLSNDNKLIATASELGTNIHVYEVESGNKLYQFRRGTFKADIHSMCFNNNNTHLVCCSNSGTAHVFDLYKDEEKALNKKSKLKFLGGYFDDHWSFKKIDIDSRDKLICGFDCNGDLYLASISGTYYKINGESYEIELKGNLME